VNTVMNVRFPENIGNLLSGLAITWPLRRIQFYGVNSLVNSLVSQLVTNFEIVPKTFNAIIKLMQTSGSI
jgi:hypothetical protein